MAHHPGEGRIPCSGTGRDGQPCGNREVEGLGACLHHVPDELLDEAEEITGFTRCRQRFGQDDACRFYAVAGTGDGPDGKAAARCKVHGANRGGRLRQGAAARVVEGRITAAAAALAADSEDALAAAVPEADPLARMLEMAGLAREWEKLARRVLGTLQTRNWRYQTGRAGEQVRAELVVWERAIERCFTMNEKISRLGIEAKMAGVRAQTADMLERALTASLEKSGCDVTGQARARAEFREHLRVIA